LAFKFTEAHPHAKHYSAVREFVLKTRIRPDWTDGG